MITMYVWWATLNTLLSFFRTISQVSIHRSMHRNTFIKLISLNLIFIQQIDFPIFRVHFCFFCSQLTTRNALQYQYTSFRHIFLSPFVFFRLCCYNSVSDSYAMIDKSRVACKDERKLTPHNEQLKKKKMLWLECSVHSVRYVHTVRSMLELAHYGLCDMHTYHKWIALQTTTSTASVSYAKWEWKCFCLSIHSLSSL